MYLYGASGHGKVVAEIAEENKYSIEAYIDEDVSKTQILDYPIIHEIPKKHLDIIISIGDNKIRKKIAEENRGFNYITLAHPKSIISRRAKISEGTVIMPGAIINSESIVGKHCIVNTNASIDHDCIIEDFVHISPNVSLAGSVHIGEGTHVGIGASIIQGVKIGNWCVIGAGAVIIKDVPNGVTIVGNPGRITKITD